MSFEIMERYAATFFFKFHFAAYIVALSVFIGMFLWEHLA